MRKMQIKILERAKKRKYDKLYIDYLSREDLKINEIQYALDYISANRKEHMPDEVVNEITKYERYNDNLKRILLPRYSPDELFGMSDKKQYLIDKHKEYQYRRNIKDYKYLRVVYWLLVMCDDESELKQDINILEHSNAHFIIDELYVANMELIAKDIHMSKWDSFFYHCVSIKCDDMERISLYDIVLYIYYKSKKLMSWTSYQEASELYKSCGIASMLDESDFLCAVASGNQFKIINTIKVYNTIKDKIKEYVNRTSFNYLINEEKACIYGNILNADESGIIDEVLNLSRKTNKDFDFFMSSEYISVTFNRNGFIDIRHISNERVSIYPYGKIYTHNIKKKSNFFITPDGNIYGKGKRGNFPCNLKQIINLNGVFGRILLEAFDELGLYEGKFIRDILRDTNNSLLVCPICFDDLKTYYNKADFINEKYNKDRALSVNWNKYNINTSYLILKALKYIDEGSINILISYCSKNDSLRFAQVKNNIKFFIVGIIEDRCKKLSYKNTRLEVIEYFNSLNTPYMETEIDDELQERLENIHGIIMDYVGMCIQSKQKINLRIKSYGQIKNLHDKVNRDANIDTYTKPVKVPSNSKFNDLRRLLPAEFEWIKSRDRLIAEAKIQHHCVWQYADVITKDTSAIYSYQDINKLYGNKRKRYTIEFCITPTNKYFVAQVQGRHDMLDTTIMNNYLNEILEKSFE